jgi:hypothetical protein
MTRRLIAFSRVERVYLFRIILTTKNRDLENLAHVIQWISLESDSQNHLEFIDKHKMSQMISVTHLSDSWQPTLLTSSLPCLTSSRVTCHVTPLSCSCHETFSQERHKCSQQNRRCRKERESRSSFEQLKHEWEESEAIYVVRVVPLKGLIILWR